MRVTSTLLVIGLPLIKIKGLFIKSKYKAIGRKRLGERVFSKNTNACLKSMTKLLARAKLRVKIEVKYYLLTPKRHI